MDRYTGIENGAVVENGIANKIDYSEEERHK